jgi:hypothetical protein
MPSPKDADLRHHAGPKSDSNPILKAIPLRKQNPNAEETKCDAKITKETKSKTKKKSRRMRHSFRRKGSTITIHST